MVKVLNLLPLLGGHGLQLVSWNQLLQHPGDHHKLRLVYVHFDPEQQPSQADHILLGALVVASQVLGQLLRAGETTV